MRMLRQRPRWTGSWTSSGLSSAFRQKGVVQQCAKRQHRTQGKAHGERSITPEPRLLPTRREAAGRKKGDPALQESRKWQISISEPQFTWAIAVRMPANGTEKAPEFQQLEATTISGCRKIEKKCGKQLRRSKSPLLSPRRRKTVRFAGNDSKLIKAKYLIGFLVPASEVL